MKVKKGEWYTECCELDLTLATSKLDSENIVGVWKTKEAALDEIINGNKSENE